MRIVHGDGPDHRVVSIEIGESARIRDLAEALGGPGAAGDVAVDGVTLAADSPLAHAPLYEGSVVTVPPVPAGPTPTARALSLIGGVRAGVAHHLADRAVATVGREPGSTVVVDDPTVSAHHARIDGDRVRDVGSRNGTFVEGRRLGDDPAALATDTVVALGATRMALRAAVDDRPAAITLGLGAARGRQPFNRPPRRLPATHGPAVVVPAGPAPPAVGEPPSIAGIVLPLVGGLVIAMLFNPVFALFAALGPVITIGTWWERRRRDHRRHRAEVRALHHALRALGPELWAWRDREVARLRARHPDPAETVRRAECPSVRCWERRPDDPDARRVAVGTAPAAFAPALRTASDDAPAAEVLALVASMAPLPEVPIEVDLTAGRVVGVVGDPTSARAVGRALLLQMATHHGPADLVVAVAADDPAHWDWVSWLPHTADPVAGRAGTTVIHTADRAGADAVASLADERGLVVLLCGDDPLQGRTTAGRRLLEHPSASAVVVVADPHRLPARCETLVTIDALGRVTVGDPRNAASSDAGVCWGIERAVAERAAQRLARLDDPELPLRGVGVPAGVALIDLLGVDPDDPAEIQRRWAAGLASTTLAVPIGADGDGTLCLDLVADGPHVLIGGTTGSGKSELLRSLVASLAASADTDHLTMVLIDYKGGAAFDCCAELPHVVGLVTDLDDGLAARALRCLEAELRHREERLRDVGAEDLAGFWAASAGRSGAEPLPRLVVIVDEFASLAAELPDFLHSLVGIAQRGRSLGVHLVLATQRPAGVVTDDIRANAGCRIALRVTDRHDSVDVIGADDAAAIPRGRPGRAVARFGPGELVPFQAALATGHSSRAAPVQVLGGPRRSPDGPTDLRRLVDTIVRAHAHDARRAPRAPWPPALPATITAADAGGRAVLMAVDLPDEQRRSTSGWDTAGHLLAVGGPRSGLTSTLAAAVLAATAGGGDEAPHVQVIDLDAGRLAPLAALSHVGTVVAPADRERRIRLLRHLDEEIASRRAVGRTTPRIVLVVDGLDGLGRHHDAVREPELHDRLQRIWADGPAVGVVAAASMRAGGPAPAGLVAGAGTVLVHRTIDAAEGLRFGCAVRTTDFPPGRVARAADGAHGQVVFPGEDLEEAASAWRGDPPPTQPPASIGVLAAEIPAETLPPLVLLGPREAELHIAVSERDLALRPLVLGRGGHALVLGPPGSGRTSVLELIGRAAPDAVIVVDSPDLAGRLGVTSVAAGAVVARLAARGPALVLVDDCCDVDPEPGLGELIMSPPDGVHVIGSARPERLRSAYGHWAAGLRESRTALLLRPDPLDGDLVGTVLPARVECAAVPGRGLLVTGAGFEEVQVVRPPRHHSPA